MNIVRENIDALNAVLTVKIEKTDYEEKVASTLKDYRRKAQVPGFRPGMVPMGMVQKMYGKSILVDEVFKQMSDALNKYIAENQLRTLGEPLPNENTKPIDFDTQTEFEFSYDLALAPEVNLSIDKSIKIPYYTISVTDEEKQKRMEGYLRYYGKMVNVNQIGIDDIATVDVTQSKEGGHTAENAMLSLKVIPEAKQKKLLGLSVGASLELDVRKLLTNDADCAAFLKVTKEQLLTLDPVFTITVKEVKRMEPAEINQELFDKVYGEGTITSETEFRAKIEAEIRTQLADESDYRFLIDTRKKLVDKTKLALPEAFLKRWLLMTSDGKMSEEQVEKEFPRFAEDLRWQLVKGHLLKQQSLEVKEEDMLDFAKKMALQQFAMYGLSNMPDEHLVSFARNILERPEERKRTAERAAENKVLDYIKSAATLEQKEITGEAFNKLFEKDAE
jgi:trigger factor